MIARAALLASLALATAAVAAPRTPQTAMAPVSDVAVMEGMPRLLSEYAFFTDLREQNPTWQVVPYRLNTPLWSDGADKLRFAYIPEGKQLSADGEGLLGFPVGSALIKTFAFGKGDERRLIETRVLLHRADGWLALPYLWNEEQTDAKLALAGARVEVVTPQGEAISYRVPNKNQCKECHSVDGAVVPIGPKARNLSDQWLAGRYEADTLDAVPRVAVRLPLWEARKEATPEAVARAYLDVNCAHCHRPGGSASNSGLDLRWGQDDPVKIGIRKRPVAAGRGSGGLAFSIAPGDPAASIILHRMESLEPGVAMPELGRSTVDEEGVAAVRAWIEGMDK